MLPPAPSCRSALLSLGGVAVLTAMYFWAPAGVIASVQAPAGNATVRIVPENLRDESWIERLKTAQVAEIANAKAFHDFQFTDRVAATGITFKHRIVDDAGKT